MPTTIAAVACPHCNAQNASGSQFCERCGKALPSARSTSPRVVSAEAMPATARGRELVADDLVKTQKRAASALLAVAILQTIMGPVLLFLQKSSLEQANAGAPAEIQPIGWFIVLGIAAAFWGLWFWARKSPLPAAIVGLVLFVTLHAIDAIDDPTRIGQGILLKIIVVAVLCKAISAGVKHKRFLAQSGSSSF